MNGRLQAILKEYSDKTESLLHEYMPKDSGFTGGRILEVMGYSLSAGGKRLRPALMLLFCRLCGGDERKAYPFAAALEMIHTYSLIHDDLPCMDDDDMRRGRPSAHKAFGEAKAVLAGDGLLGYAFELALTKGPEAGLSEGAVLEAVKELAYFSGIHGMLGGQVADIESEGREQGLAELTSIYLAKTGALLRAAARVGCIAAQANENQKAAADRYASALGLLFQITDDILDETGSAEKLGKNTGSDKRQGKTTYVTLLGGQGALGAAKSAYEEAVAETYAFAEGELLRELALMVLERES